MAKFAIIRLGKDSVAEIRELDALKKSPNPPLAFDITCSQVPQDLNIDDFVFICLGSDNNQGTPTAWSRGLRALGTVRNKTGGPQYNDQWIVNVEVSVALPDSVTKMDFLAVVPDAYFWASAIPVIGVDTHSNQTVQMIKTAEAHQKIEALVFGLTSIHPSFRVDTLAAYPTLASFFNYVPPAPPRSRAAEAAAASMITDTAGAIDLSQIIDRFLADAGAADLRVDKAEAHRFFASLLAKRFLIASGLAGSGKTKLAQAFAQWLTPKVTAVAPKKCYEILPVGADWTGNENILGYANGLDDKDYISKPALNLVLQANENLTIPHILVLDEMNLSHVERYFADVLSVIESGEKLNLHSDADRKSDGMAVPKSLALPKNLFIIGTVNVDETTYMFSPKVLDRANVIEFRMDGDELAAFLANPKKPDLSTLAGKGAAFGSAFVEGASLQIASFGEPLKSQYESEMLLFFRALSGNGAEFGFRVAYEAARFIYFYQLLGGHVENEPLWFYKAFDCLVAQKFLPKLHGSRAKLGPLLKKLWFLCVRDVQSREGDAIGMAELAAKSTEKSAEPTLVVPDNAPYAVSAEKIGRMWRLLNDNGFASFAEA